MLSFGLVLFFFDFGIRTSTALPTINNDQQWRVEVTSLYVTRACASYLSLVRVMALQVLIQLA
jgi:hypothetical protein